VFSTYNSLSGNTEKNKIHKQEDKGEYKSIMTNVLIAVANLQQMY